MPRILSGMTPTGDPHIGNYFGMMKPMLDSQDISEVDLYFFMSDQHTFTSKKDPEEFRRNSFNCAVDWIALGIDPDKAVFFRQSDVRAHTELAWYLSCLCPMGLLERAHAFKDKTSKGV
ncbi:MAG TPA: tryptophan--tRNA ligase, partial [Candidatus Gracilibacteria bacterium]